MTIAQRTQLAALRALRNHPELGKTHEDRRLPTALGVLSDAREGNGTPAADAEAAAKPAAKEATGKACPLALKLLLEG